MASALGGFGAGVIGGGTVTLFLDDAKYRASLAQDEAATKSGLSSMGKTTGAFKAYAVAAWAAVAAAVIKFALDSVAAYEDHEAALATLRNAVGEGTAAFEDQASALQDLTGVSDEEILRMDALLSRFELTNSEIMEATPIILDYARATGKDAVDASTQIGKALLGNTKALKTVGIRYTATGNASEDFGNVMDLLKKKVEGASTELSESEQRSIKMRVAIDELQEGFGKLIVDAVGPLIEDLATLADTFSDVTASMGGGGEGGGLSAASLLGQLAFSNLSKGVRAVNEVLETFDNAMGGIGTTVTPAEGAVDDLKEAMNDLGVTSKKTGRNIAFFAGKTGDDLQEWRESTAETFDTAADVWDTLADKATVLGRRILMAFKKQTRALRDYDENLETAKRHGASDELLESLSEMGLEGAVILEGLADSSQKEIDKVNRAFATNHQASEKISHDFIDVRSNLDKLKGQKAAMAVNVHYSWSGIDPGRLPGLASGPDS